MDRAKPTTNVVAFQPPPKECIIKHQKIDVRIVYNPSDNRWHWSFEIEHRSTEKFRGDSATLKRAQKRATDLIDELV